MSSVILTCFAGRKSCMSLLLKYVEDLMRLGHVQEFHAWNFAKDPTDETWLKQQIPYQLYPSKSITKSTTGYSYIPSGLFITARQRSFTLKVKCPSDAYLLLKSPNSDFSYEILLGGWGNRASVVRQGKQGKDLNHLLHHVFKPNEYANVRVTLTDKNIEVYLLDVKQSFTAPHSIPVDVWSTLLLDVYLAGWNNNTVEWSYKDSYSFSEEFQTLRNRTTSRNPIKLFHPSNKKQWSEYYGHYSQHRYPDNVIIKCDDDIVFIDTNTFPKYISERVKDDTHVLMFPSIINNEICAYYQQRHGIIPEHIVNIGYEPFGWGPLWKDGVKTQRLHEFFINNASRVLQKSKYTTHRIQDIITNARISINFFAVKSKDLYVFQIIGQDDEYDLTQWIPGALKRNNCIFMECIVSHLAFYKQKETGLDSNKVLNDYISLCDTCGTTKVSKVSDEEVIKDIVNNIVNNVIEASDVS